MDTMWKSGSFMGASEDYHDADAVIFGAPMDFTVSFRPGARFGPEKIRSMSIVLEEYSHYLSKDLNSLNFFDAGDLTLPFGNVEKSLALIHDAAHRFFSDNKFPVLLGGEHLVSFPVIQAAFAKYPELRVIQLDAHADLRTEYEGEANSHATVIRKTAELIGDHKVYQLGIRSGTKEEFVYAKEHTHLYFNQLLSPLAEVIPACGNHPVYLTVDIDVMDPSSAPGTGTPEPGGFSSKEVLEVFHRLQKLNIIGFDVVEVCPPYDNGEITSVVAAKLVREGLLGFVKNR